MKPISQGIRDYLALRRALGFQFEHVEGALRNFASFLEEKKTSRLTSTLMVEWAKIPRQAQPAQWAKRLGMVRDFARFWKSTDPLTELPPDGLLPYCYRRRPPYIYTELEIEHLLAAASQLIPRDGLRRHTYFTLFGLIAAAGLRLSESIDLDQKDVDFSRGLLSVRNTKFGKSRLVPLHASTLERLRGYVRTRNRFHSRPRVPAFFVSDRGIRVTKDSVRWAFIAMSKQSALRAPSDRRGPRIHDLRHSFAVRTLMEWYRTGKNIDQQMPLLSTYLGHDHPSDTYWYLSAVPELLAYAGKRLEKQMGGVL